MDIFYQNLELLEIPHNKLESLARKRDVGVSLLPPKLDFRMDWWCKINLRFLLQAKPKVWLFTSFKCLCFFKGKNKRFQSTVFNFPEYPQVLDCVFERKNPWSLNLLMGLTEDDNCSTALWKPPFQMGYNMWWWFVTAQSMLSSAAKLHAVTNAPAANRNEPSSQARRVKWRAS